MKKIILTAAALASSLTFFGQNQSVSINSSFGYGQDLQNFIYNNQEVGTYSIGWYNITGSAEARLSSWGGIKMFTTNIERLTITQSGLVGIGTNEPISNLEVSGDFNINKSLFLETAKQISTSNGNTKYYGAIGQEDKAANIAFTMYGDDSTDRMSFMTDYQNSGTYTERMVIKPNNGYVGIGSTNPDSELTVKGKIHCEEVQVDLSVPADYVFEKYYTGASELKEDYNMPTLAEVETYTKENHHLPNIPSAAEIKEEGLHLKEMTNLLLQKIEELTLYTIEQEKRIKVLEAKLTSEK